MDLAVKEEATTSTEEDCGCPIAAAAAAAEEDDLLLSAEPSLAEEALLIEDDNAVLPSLEKEMLQDQTATTDKKADSDIVMDFGFGMADEPATKEETAVE